MTESKQISIQTTKEANEILGITGVIDLMKQFGDVRVGGSFYTGLMYGTDIDFTVAAQNPKQKAIEYLNAIIKANKFQKYEYGNFEEFPRDKRPHGHMIVLVLPFNGKKWEIETWFLKEHIANQIKLETELKSLSQEQKDEIIELKHKRVIEGKDKHELSSFDIYKKFLADTSTK